ncbi:unnamed protein product [Cylindrotheca closterium]|uniref:Uncharacterized protein n=1 Tax=Cylindrotheca closterium TaxID=2856 RepID=A0AAD2JII4_9STRA|nr:unnamed protein product [Cylindrotheca closterium]
MDSGSRIQTNQEGGYGLYQVQWDLDPPQQALYQPTDESPTLYFLSSPDYPMQQQRQQQQHRHQHLRQSTPRMTTEYEVASNPGDAVFSYTMFLAGCLATFLLYLLLPKGFRKQYFQAKRKRYARSDDRDMPAAGYWLPVKRQQQQQQQQPTSAESSRGSRSPARSHQLAHPVTPERTPRKNNDVPPSPEHPALHTLPPNKIIAETMARLQNRGIRLVAHGVHCNPKRVWIKLDDESTSVTWQTEFPRRVPNQSGKVSIVLMRGSLHRIALCNVLYIDVGKKTNALQKLPESVPAPCCFSLLTQNGSLDLQANSKLERDALVSCFSMILDDVHTEDWRAIYEATPEPSLVNSGAGDEGPTGKGTMVMNL